ncbi:hypothetical protein DSM104299_03937 [Baekduia alba]|uniref:DUF7144 family membrane protein n=1 Tax=Baekduia alba TaxID=2997333 RepID=UPI0023409327|nr:hypothetical protein [Baekduia alba]WCB95194.1 hypothetical protein DSM104299_03937 [Baekduia alba]
MSTSAEPRGTPTPLSAQPSAPVDDGRGYGWVLFAGMMLAIVGTLNFVYGIAAIGDSKFYVKDAQFVISNLNVWGWFLVIVGAVQVISAVGIWAQAAGARWVGIISAGVNATIQMLAISAYPFLALALFGVDILIIYGLLAHGRRAST